jgi:hypothetical protein
MTDASIDRRTADRRRGLDRRSGRERRSREERRGESVRVPAERRVGGDRPGGRERRRPGPRRTGMDLRGSTRRRRLSTSAMRCNCSRTRPGLRGCEPGAMADVVGAIARLRFALGNLERGAPWQSE